MTKEEQEAEDNKFLREVLSRVSGARIALLEGDKHVTSLVTTGEVVLETKRVTLPRNLMQVSNFIQGHVTSYLEPGDSRVTVIVGIDNFEAKEDTVSFDIGFGRDVVQDKVDPKQEAKDAKLAAKAPAPEAFNVAEVEDKK